MRCLSDSVQLSLKVILLNLDSGFFLISGHSRLSLRRRHRHIDEHACVDLSMAQGAMLQP